jgi:hypothetical protein
MRCESASIPYAFSPFRSFQWRYCASLREWPSRATDPVFAIAFYLSGFHTWVRSQPPTVDRRHERHLHAAPFPAFPFGFSHLSRFRD